MFNPQLLFPPYNPPMFDHLAEDMGLLIQRGGYVMWPLLGLSVISIILIVERLWFWGSVHGLGRMRKMAALTSAIRSGDRATTEALIARDQSPYGRVAAHLMKHGADDDVAAEAVEMQRPRLQRFMVTLSTIITAAPLLGILGTVIGIIQSFRLLGQQSVLTDPRDVAGGIAAALLTTALGLIVAVFTLFPYMSFKTQVDRALGRMEMLIAVSRRAELGRKNNPERIGEGMGEGEEAKKTSVEKSEEMAETLSRSAS